MKHLHPYESFLNESLIDDKHIEELQRDVFYKRLTTPVKFTQEETDNLELLLRMTGPDMERHKICLPEEFVFTNDKIGVGKKTGAMFRKCHSSNPKYFLFLLDSPTEGYYVASSLQPLLEITAAALGSGAGVEWAKIK